MLKSKQHSLLSGEAMNESPIGGFVVVVVGGGGGVDGGF